MAAVELVPGVVFARDFLIQRELSEGGMGVVYVALQQSTGRLRALKVMQPDLLRSRDPAVADRNRERFLQEARIGGRIASEHVVEVVAAGIDDASGAPWLAMELLDGNDLAKELATRGPLPLAEVLGIFEELCHALREAHAAKVLHLDLKPENVFLARSRRADGRPTVKVLDFGIARLVGEHRKATKVTSGLGSPLWMAPEQASRGAEVSPATDVWAMGLIAYRVLTGVHYWRAGNVADDQFDTMKWLMEVATAPLEPASVRASEHGVAGFLPPGFDDWFGRCVARDVTHRFADAGNVIEGLRPLGASVGAAIGAPGSFPGTGPGGQGPVVRTELALPPMTRAPSAQPPTRLTPAPTRRFPLIVGGVVAATAVLTTVWFVGSRSVSNAPAPAARPAPPITAVTPAATPLRVPAAAPPAVPAVIPPVVPPFVAVRDAGVAPSGAGGDVVSERILHPQSAVGAGSAGGGQGTIDANAVHRLVRGQMGAIQACYERAVRNNPTLQGRLELHFTIGTTGRVDAVTANGLEAAPEVGTCVVSRIRGLVFPAPRNGTVDFSFPFTFVPGG